jgi:hypothetical protein
MQQQNGSLAAFHFPLSAFQLFSFALSTFRFPLLKDPHVQFGGRPVHDGTLEASVHSG